MCFKFHGQVWQEPFGEINNDIKALISQPIVNKYFIGDGVLGDGVRHYQITGRIDGVIIVSGHNLGTVPIENAINIPQLQNLQLLDFHMM